MPETIISDTSCLIILENIGELILLQKMYATVTTTAVVAEEYGLELPGWFVVKSPANSHYQQILELQVDRGEASAIALAIESEGCTLIVDDHKARKVAAGLGLKITGTIGVIIKAKLMGVIPSIKPLLDKIKQSDFRLSEDLIERAYLEAQEIR